MSATRSELLLRQARIRLALQGRDLLEEKRKQLLEVLGHTVLEVLSGREALEHAALEARQALGWAEASAGPEQIRSASWAASGEVQLEARVTCIMGVQVPLILRGEVGRALTDRGYALSASGARVDHVAERFEAEVDLALEQAAQELRMRRLAEEIGRTTRRVNALQHVVLPRLQQQRARIAQVLEEREREDRFRLRRLKQRRRP